MNKFCNKLADMNTNSPAKVIEPYLLTGMTSPRIRFNTAFACTCLGIPVIVIFSNICALQEVLALT